MISLLHAHVTHFTVMCARRLYDPTRATLPVPARGRLEGWGLGDTGGHKAGAQPVEGRHKEDIRHKHTEAQPANTVV